MKCLYCGDKMEFKNTNIELCIENDIYVVKNVPAYVCERCGEKVIGQEVASRIYELISKKEAEAHIQVPVFEYA
ncbi:YgiT-type zinc finger protein [candidate division WOR-3 bacterium]|nr:YgiT-type zinc finger protein [candidate division WOR-3 bacterium]